MLGCLIFYQECNLTIWDYYWWVKLIHNPSFNIVENLGYERFINIKTNNITKKCKIKAHPIEHTCNLVSAQTSPTLLHIKLHASWNQTLLQRMSYPMCCIWSPRSIPGKVEVWFFFLLLYAFLVWGACLSYLTGFQLWLLKIFRLNTCKHLGSFFILLQRASRSSHHHFLALLQRYHPCFSFIIPFCLVNVFSPNFYDIC